MGTRIVAPKSSDYDTRVANTKRFERLSILSKKPQMTQPEKDEALKLLLEDFSARNPTS